MYMQQKAISTNNPEKRSPWLSGKLTKCIEMFGPQRKGLQMLEKVGI